MSGGSASAGPPLSSPDASRRVRTFLRTATHEAMTAAHAGADTISAKNQSGYPRLPLPTGSVHCAPPAKMSIGAASHNATPTPTPTSASRPGRDPARRPSENIQGSTLPLATVNPAATNSRPPPTPRNSVAPRSMSEAATSVSTAKNAKAAVTFQSSFVSALLRALPGSVTVTLPAAGTRAARHARGRVGNDPT